MHTHLFSTYSTIFSALIVVNNIGEEKQKHNIIIITNSEYWWHWRAHVQAATFHLMSQWRKDKPEQVIPSLVSQMAPGQTSNFARITIRIQSRLNWKVATIQVCLWVAGFRSVQSLWANRVAQTESLHVLKSRALLNSGKWNRNEGPWPHVCIKHTLSLVNPAPRVHANITYSSKQHVTVIFWKLWREFRRRCTRWMNCYLPSPHQQLRQLTGQLG